MRRLTEPFFEDPGRIHQMVGHDGVEHSHATFVEHTEDCLLAPQLLGDRRGEPPQRLGDFYVGQRHDMVGGMPELPFLEPAAERIAERFVGEVFTPQRGIFLPGLGERGVEIQQPDQPRPLARPVRHGENRTFVRKQSREHMMRVLPRGLGDDQRRRAIDAREHIHPFALRADEAVILLGLELMVNEFIAGIIDGLMQRFFHLGLGWPAAAIGRWRQIAAGDEQHLPRLQLRRTNDLWQHRLEKHSAQLAGKIAEKNLPLADILICAID